MIPNEPDDRDVLAGEYVLGTLDPELASEVEGALATDPDLAARVAFWQTRLLSAAAAVPPVPPEPGLWPRIERSLGRAAVALPPARRRSVAHRLWDSPALWRGATALATAAAVMLAIVPRVSPTPPAAPRYFALLQTRDASGAETGPGWIIRVEEDGTVLSEPLRRVEPGSGRALQLWTLWDQARGPVSLGVLPPGGALSLPADRLPVIGRDQLFEITLEPPAGSPTGRPTGRVLFIGRASASPTQAL